MHRETRRSRDADLGNGYADLTLPLSDVPGEERWALATLTTRPMGLYCLRLRRTTLVLTVPEEQVYPGRELQLTRQRGPERQWMQELGPRLVAVDLTDHPLQYYRHGRWACAGQT